MAKDIAPSELGVAVTPSDVNPISAPRAIYVGTAGNLSLKYGGQATAVLYKNVPAGTLLPYSPQYVMSTNTTAADIVAQY